MPILDRNKPKPFGSVDPSVEQKPVPYEHDLSRVGNKPHDFVTLLLSLQQKVYGATILDRISHAALMAHAKRLSISYTSDHIKQAILKAAETSPAPFSMSYVERLLKRGETQ